ncbi:MAG TPA: neprosin family prolyl endopeptidase [Ktedonobacteraceae bacterium]
MSQSETSWHYALPGVALAATSTDNYYYAGAFQQATANHVQGASGNFNQPDPSLSPDDGHTLAELAVRDFNAQGQQETVEVGWLVDPAINHDARPHLFVFYWVDGNQKCYNTTCPGFVPVAGAAFKPGDPVAVDSSSDTTHQYFIQFVNGDWWVGYQGQWIGDFPGSLWGNTFTSATEIQWFGEVVTRQSVPCSQMGDGLHGGKQNSAVINNMYLYVGSKSVRANAQPNTVTNSQYYSLGHFKIDSFTYGGPGASTKQCPSAWPMSGHSSSGARYNPYETTLSPANVGKLTLAWSAATNVGSAQRYNIAPVIANGIAYIDDAAGQLEAVKASNGKMLWTTSLPGSLFSTPAVANGLVYIYQDNGFLYAFNATTGGRPSWSQQIAGGEFEVVDNVLYEVASETAVYAFNALTGNLIWTAPGAYVGVPAVASGRLYVFDDSGNLEWLDANTGVVLASSAIGGGFYSNGYQAVVANGIVYAPSNKTGTLDAFSAQTGQGLWAYNNNSSPGSPAVANGIVYIGDDGNVDALDAYTGALLWYYQTTGLNVGEPAVANGVLYVASLSGYVYAFLASTGGSPLWAYQVSSGIRSDVAVAAGMVYAGGYGNGIEYAFHLPAA